MCLLNLVLWGQLLFYYSLWYNFLSYTNNVVLGHFCEIFKFIMAIKNTFVIAYRNSKCVKLCKLNI